MCPDLGWMPIAVSPPPIPVSDRQPNTGAGTASASALEGPWTDAVALAAQPLGMASWTTLEPWSSASLTDAKHPDREDARRTTSTSRDETPLTIALARAGPRL